MRALIRWRASLRTPWTRFNFFRELFCFGFGFDRRASRFPRSFFSNFALHFLTNQIPRRKAVVELKHNHVKILENNADNMINIFLVFKIIQWFWKPRRDCSHNFLKSLHSCVWAIQPLLAVEFDWRGSEVQYSKTIAGNSGRSKVEAKAKEENFTEEVEAGSACSQRGSSTAWLWPKNVEKFGAL